MLTQEQKQRRLGKITGSVMKIIMEGGTRAWITLLDQKKRELEEPEAVLAESKEIYAKPLVWGNKHEPIAIAHYELTRNIDTTSPELSIVHPDIDYVAALPDFLCDVVGEVKCPYNEEVHAMTVLHGMGVTTYRPQMQCEIWCTGKDGAHFVSYDPRYPDPSKRLIIIDVERDDGYIEQMTEKCAQFWDYLQTDTRPQDIGGLDEIPEIF